MKLKTRKGPGHYPSYYKKVRPTTVVRYRGSVGALVLVIVSYFLCVCVFFLFLGGTPPSDHNTPHPHPPARPDGEGAV